MKNSKGRPIETHPTETRNTEARNTEARPVEAQPAEARPAESRLAEEPPVEARAAVSRLSDERTTNDRTANERTTNDRTVNERTFDERSSSLSTGSSSGSAGGGQFFDIGGRVFVGSGVKMDTEPFSTVPVIPAAPTASAVSSDIASDFPLAQITEGTSRVISVPQSAAQGAVQGTPVPTTQRIVVETQPQKLSGCAHCTKGCTMCTCGCCFGMMATGKCCGRLCSDCCTRTCECWDEIWLYCFLCDTENATCPCSCC